MQVASYIFKATKELCIEDYGALQVHKLNIIIMYLECSHPKLNHDNIIQTLMMALIAIRGN